MSEEETKDETDDMAVDASTEAPREEGDQDAGDDSKDLTHDECLGLDAMSSVEQCKRMYPSLPEGARELFHAVSQQTAATCRDVEQTRIWYRVDKSGWNKYYLAKVHRALLSNVQAREGLGDLLGEPGVWVRGCPPAARVGLEPLGEGLFPSLPRATLKSSLVDLLPPL